MLPQFLFGKQACPTVTGRRRVVGDILRYWAGGLQYAALRHVPTTTSSLSSLQLVWRKLLDICPFHLCEPQIHR
ncbi:hypothetical protein KSP40_PGU012093 [Platanthera guangdongensis]|uniref:Uncharacterized protein n=1 Tax=Platanthera guangdongensis TaxID=2320717 RepID=A0ABR2ML05_9ASPA